MQSSNNIPVESYKKLYDGDYSNFKEFSEDIKILLRPLNSLAIHILEGTISVTKMRRGPKTNYRQEGRITTSVELLHSAIRTYERAGNTDVVSLLASTLIGCSEKVISTIDAIAKDHSESKEAERLKTPQKFYPRSVIHSSGELDEEIPWGELIEAVESDESYEKRKGDNIWATPNFALG